MPGISLAIGADLAGQQGKARLARTQEAMKHEPAYHDTVVLSQDDVFLGWTGYPGYPVCVFESGGYHVAVEGHVYNRDDNWVKTSLTELVDRIEGGRDVESEVGRWVRLAEGDYVVVLLNLARKRLYFFNDATGRLPLYFYGDDERFLLSREVKFLAGLMPSVKYDRQGIAETLFFGYTLGARTLVEGAARLEFGTLVRVDLETLKCKHTSIHSFDFEEYRHAGKPIKEMAGELKELFVEACRHLKATFGDRPLVVSLSGGLDSRSVAAGMLAAGAEISAATFQDAGLLSKGVDATIAKVASRALDIEWQLFDVEAIRIDDVRLLLSMKDGMNHAGMAFILPFFRKLRSFLGPGMVYLTGDVGDRSMEVQGPPRTVRSFDGLVNLVLGRNGVLDIGRVAAMTFLDKEGFRNVVEQRIREYPEQDLNARYTHFLMAERLGSWNWQAEDRNRGFFWSATPFSLFSVFDYAMNVPRDAKRYHRLYEQFMAALAPQCVGIDNANWGAPFASFQRYLYPFLHNCYGKLPAPLQRFVRDRIYFRGYTVEPTIGACFDECLASCPTVRDYLSEEHVADFLRRGCTRNTFENLLTVAGYIRTQEEMLSGI